MKKARRVLVRVFAGVRKDGKVRWLVRKEGTGHGKEDARWEDSQRKG